MEVFYKETIIIYVFKLDTPCLNQTLHWLASPLCPNPSKNNKNKKCGHVTCHNWQVTRDMWHMKVDMCHVTRNLWHVTPDTLQVGWGEPSLKISAP